MFMRCAALAAFLVVAAQPGSAALLSWTLQGATFDDGGTASGGFDYDAATNTVSNWSISVSGGNLLLFPVLDYNDANSTASAFGDQFFRFVLSGGSPREVRLSFTSPLTDAGGTTALAIGLVGGSVECYNCAPFRLFDAGTATANPEPSTFLLTALPIAALMLRRRKRNKA